MSAQTIYFKLVEAGMSPEGACAMLGNMQAESAMRSNNVQDGYGYTDEGYTAKVDAGQLTRSPGATGASGSAPIIIITTMWWTTGWG